MKVPFGVLHFALCRNLEGEGLASDCCKTLSALSDLVPVPEQVREFREDCAVGLLKRRGRVPLAVN